jgi:hypothetical protein
MAFSPYANGSYLVPTTSGSSEEYILYCSCRKPPVSSRWRWSELKKYAVSKAAHHRGYGTTQEIVPVNTASGNAKPFSAATWLNVNPTR